MNPDLRLQPELFGPLDETAPPVSGAHELFPGEDRYLGASARRKRAELLSKVASSVEKILEDGEEVLYVAPAIQKVTLGQYLALGWISYHYNHVALVITDRRIVEVQLTFGGKAPAEQVRSYPWKALSRVSYRMGSVVANPGKGKSQAWRVRIRGDRKLLKLLLPRVATQQAGADGPTETVPTVHCPSCGTGLPPKPASCAGCGTRFRSARLAAGLSLAFPGAGLLYAGAPVLAFFDFVGEMLLLVVFTVMLATAANPAVVLAAAMMAACFAVITKLESLHVGHLMVSRLRSEPVQRTDRFRKLARTGAVFSVVAVAVLVAITGRFASVIDRDLDFSSSVIHWSGTRDPEMWTDFADNPDLRSQWYHEDGWVVSVFSYALRHGESLEKFRRDFLAELETNGSEVLDESTLPGGLSGFRVLQGVENGDEPLALLNYFVFDDENHDVHQVLLVAFEDEVPDAEATMAGLMDGVGWIEPGA